MKNHSHSSILPLSSLKLSSPLLRREEKTTYVLWFLFGFIFSFIFGLSFSLARAEGIDMEQGDAFRSDTAFLEAGNTENKLYTKNIRAGLLSLGTHAFSEGVSIQVTSPTVSESQVRESEVTDSTTLSSTIASTSLSASRVTTSGIFESRVSHGTITNSSLRQSVVEESIVSDSTLSNTRVLDGSQVIRSNLFDVAVRKAIIVDGIMERGEILFPDGRKKIVTSPSPLVALIQFPPAAHFRFVRGNSRQVTIKDMSVGPHLLSQGNSTEYILYEWDLGDGTKLSSTTAPLGKVLSHRYEHDGEYDVTLTLTDAFGKTSSFVEKLVISSDEDVLHHGGEKPRSSHSAQEGNESPIISENLTLGAEGTSVLHLQKRLMVEGFYEGEASGTYDREVLTAVLAYQKAFDLPLSGEVRPLTRAFLNRTSLQRELERTPQREGRVLSLGIISPAKSQTRNQKDRQPLPQTLSDIRTEENDTPSSAVSNLESGDSSHNKSFLNGLRKNTATALDEWLDTYDRWFK